MIHRAKKSLGQNFLKSQPALAMMITAGDVQKTDTVVEIGPGKGALTEKLLVTGCTVIAIEKDRDLVAILTEKFPQEISTKRLILLADDCLNFNPLAYDLENTSYKLVANIPYNITGAILKKFLEEELQPKRMILLVQKEVAERIVARDGKESILSLSVKAYGTPKYMMKVSKRFFSPAPNVDSAIIAITDISRYNFTMKYEEEIFFKVIRAGFAHKRKVVRKNLEDITTPDLIHTLFDKLAIQTSARAEDLPLATWLQLSQNLNNSVHRF
jgi:16S rRNA (adenine1518-N6/adenine1519-N6)-dimethyltransferase